MPAGNFLYRHEFLTVAMLLSLLLIATEIGFRRGSAIRSGLEDSVKSHYWTIQAGVMGLLALLLAFTFSMAISRYDTRTQLVVAEANAISTARARARMIAQPYSSEGARLLDLYVACRLRDYSVKPDRTGVVEAKSGCGYLRDQLWSQAIGAVKKDPSPVPTGLFVSSLNDVSDLAARRDAARENHVPQPVLVFLFLVSVLTLGLLGYGCGLGNRRHLAATASVCLLISLVILVIVDLDHPRRGLIHIDQAPMLDLRSADR